MSLEQKINNDLKDAMRAKDQAAMRSIRAVKAAILLAKTEKGASGELSADKELSILQKMVKQRNDSIRIFTEQGRDDLAQTEKEEVEVIRRYLPEQMSPEALKAAVQEIIDTTGASQMSDLGRVMGQASKALKGKADGSAIAATAKELLGA